MVVFIILALRHFLACSVHLLALDDLSSVILWNLSISVVISPDLLGLYVYPILCHTTYFVSYYFRPKCLHTLVKCTSIGCSIRTWTTFTNTFSTHIDF